MNTHEAIEKLAVYLTATARQARLLTALLMTIIIKNSTLNYW
jgi:hypothetical protein